MKLIKTLFEAKLVELFDVADYSFFSNGLGGQQLGLVQPYWVKYTRSHLT